MLGTSLTSDLSSRHLPLFLVSLLIVIVYITPFTLLVLLGPLLDQVSAQSSELGQQVDAIFRRFLWTLC